MVTMFIEIAKPSGLAPPIPAVAEARDSHLPKPRRAALLRETAKQRRRSSRGGTGGVDDLFEAAATGNAPFKVYRRPEGEPDKPRRWYRLRQGIADRHRRAEICQKVNQRYLNAFAAVDTDTTLEELVDAIQRPVEKQSKRHRALSPFAEPDVLLWEASSRGEFLMQGLRNRDLNKILYQQPASS